MSEIIKNWISAKEAREILGKGRGWICQNRDKYRIRTKKEKGVQGLLYHKPSVIEAAKKVNGDYGDFISINVAVGLLNEGLPVKVTPLSLKINIERENWRIRSKKEGSRRLYKKADVELLIKKLAA